MLLDCPYWVKHGDDGINGLDVSPNGRRLATCGRNIIIWNMLPILDSKAELDPDVPKVLAIMQEQEKGVLTVKFSNSGRFLAAGSSYPDNSVLIFKQVASPATTNMSIKFTGKENWRPTAAALKHHINDVTSLSWSPGDEYLASGAMDGNIMVWKVNQDGRCQLHHSIDREHNGWVKGLAFDPIGRYLATQGRNGVKVWDMQRGWALVSHMQKPFEGAVEQGLRYRTSWSPDGEILIAANGFEHQQRTICTFQRQTWEVTEMVGHQGAVLVVAANPRLFYPPVQLHDQRRQQNDEDEQPGGSGGAAAAAARGGSKAAALLFGDEPCSVFAAGSTDKTISMWNTELPRAVIRVSQVHSGAFVDMAWTPDGYTLIAAAGDDKVSVMRFGLSEMGKALTEAEFRNVLDSEYNPAAAAAGDGQAYGAEAGLQTQEDAALAALALQEDMAAAMNVAFPTPPRPARHPSNAAAAACAGAPLQLFSGATGTAAAAAPAGVMPAPVRQAAAAAGPVGGMSGGALERRLMPQGGGATTGTLAQPRQQQQQSAGQKRLHPTSTHGPAAAAAAAAGGSGALGYPAKRPSTGPQQQQGMMRPAGGVSRGGGWVLSPPAIPFRLETMVALMTEHQHQGGQQYQSVVLLVENQRRGAGSSSAAGRGGGAEVSLHLGGLPGHVLWTDRTPEPIVAAAGTAYFAAAATASGLLYTWRGGGNALLPPLALGSPPVSMSAQGHFQLLVVGADGSILTLDLEQKQRQFCGSVPAPNLAAVLAASAPGTGLKEAWLTSGSNASPGSSSSSVQVPIGRTQAAVLTDSSAWLFHPQLGLWVMLAPPAGLASAPAQLAANALPSTATLAPHPDADKLRSARAAVATSQQVQQGVEAVWLRQEAACQLTAAELLGDTLGYQRWLKQLVLLLARQNEPMRLHELCQDLLGPERWDPSMVGHAWSPKVIGLEKRIMLDHLVIPTMAKEKLAMATQVHACLQAAQEHARQATGRLVASGWRLQPASSAASPAAAAAGLQQQPPAPSTMPGRDAATPGSNNHAAVGAMVGSQQQPQQADMAALSAQTHPWQLQANASAGQQQQQQQQQSGLQAAAAAANGTPQGAAVVAPRWLQAMPIGPLPPQPQAQQQQWPSQQGQLPQQQQGNGAVQHQQQQQAGAWPPVGPGPANGVEAAVRIPLQEQQQPHALTQQATPCKQQQPLQPAEKPAASGPAVEPGMQNS